MSSSRSEDPLGLPLTQHGSRGGQTTRGEFLAETGFGLAALALAASDGKRRRHRRRRRNPRQESLRDIDHVVILMQENRSFDHYFGTLSGVRGFDDPDAITLDNGRSVFHQPYSGSPEGYLLPYPLASTGSSVQCVQEGVHQGWQETHKVWHHGKVDRWLAGENTPLTMAYLTRADIPFYYALADAFTVCDRFFCSVLGPTYPNRYMMWTGTIDPKGKDGGPKIDNEVTRLRWRTYPERLEKAGVSWRVYHEDDDYDDNVLPFFEAYKEASKKSPLYRNALKNRPFEALEDDVRRGRLPQVSWLVAPTLSAEHPGSGSVAAGEDYVSRSLAALTSNPDVWARTVFILTYDEHGGFFDHVKPPTPRKGTPEEFVFGRPIGLGFRVPTVICSPFTRGGRVCSDTFDFTSLIRLTERRFGVREPNISAWRRKRCGDLTSVFDFENPDYDVPDLPATGPLVAAAELDCKKSAPPEPPPIQTEPTQEPGERPRIGGHDDK
jgi:phospholipase C